MTDSKADDRPEKVEVILVGTGPAQGTPELYCSCKVCKSARSDEFSHDRRAESAVLVKAGNSRVLFDALLQGNAPRTAVDVPYGTPAMAQAVTRLVLGQTALPVLFVMAGHDEGVVAYGADVASATRLMVETFQKVLSHDQDRHHRR